MDLRSGHPFWLIRNGLLSTFAPLDKDVKCDVVIIGAGITGALVAWHLVEAGFRTVILDKRDAAWGSTAASTALVQYEIDTQLRELIPRLGEEHAVRAYLACRDGVHKLRDLVSRLADHCDLEVRPSLQVAPTPKAAAELEEEYALRVQYGFDVDWLDAPKLRKLFSFDKPGGLLSRDSVQLDPYRLTHELLTLAQAKGLRVHDRTDVIEHDLSRRQVVLRTDRDSVVRARYAVFATGYEAPEFLNRKIVDLTSTFAMVSEPLPGPVWYEDCLIWERAQPYLYMRTTNDHRVMVGGEDEPFHDADARDALLQKKTRKLQKKFATYFPRVPFEVAFFWAGTFGETKDGLAYIGQVPECPRSYFTLGFGGNGTTYSILAAEIIRDRLQGRASPYDGLFEFGR